MRPAMTGMKLRVNPCNSVWLGRVASSHHSKEVLISVIDLPLNDA